MAPDDTVWTNKNTASAASSLAHAVSPSTATLAGHAAAAAVAILSRRDSPLWRKSADKQGRWERSQLSYASAQNEQHLLELLPGSKDPNGCF